MGSFPQLGAARSWQTLPFSASSSTDQIERNVIAIIGAVRIEVFVQKTRSGKYTGQCHS